MHKASEKFLEFRKNFIDYINRLHFSRIIIKMIKILSANCRNSNINFLIFCIKYYGKNDIKRKLYLKKFTIDMDIDIHKLFTINTTILKKTTIIVIASNIF